LVGSASGLHTAAYAEVDDHGKQDRHVERQDHWVNSPSGQESRFRRRLGLAAPVSSQDAGLCAVCFGRRCLRPGLPGRWWVARNHV
jgi:hypothetical protein